MLHLKRSLALRSKSTCIVYRPRCRLFSTHNSNPRNTSMEEKAKRSHFWSTIPFLSSQKETATSDNSQEKKDAEKTKKEDLISSLLAANKSNKWFTDKMEWLELPSMEKVNAKMNGLYPQWTLQLNQVKEGYQRLWDYLTMEDFRRIVAEIKKDGESIDLFPEIARDATVAETSNLSEKEKEFIKNRKKIQKRSFAKFIGVDEDEVEECDIPVVGLASSGGGYRAMIGLTGYLAAMKDTGALEQVMYFTGVSGSCWTMALYYNKLTNADPHALKKHLKERVGIHWANMSYFFSLLTHSPETSKVLLQGAVQRYRQQKGDLSLVDMFGILMGGTLLRSNTTTAQPSRTEDDADDDKKQQEQHKMTMNLSSQSEFIKDGSEPLPIYCVVRHDITQDKTLEARIKELKSKEPTGKEEIRKKENKESQNPDAYQWFEFTPYDMGCEELEAWIPTWAFGRQFEKGQNKERLPEQTLDILMGTFGSAFAASLVHFYQEIKSLLPAGSLNKLDDAVQRYEASMSSYHPISPSSFPNPFYKIPDTFTLKNGKQVKRPEAIVGSKELYLMDAGMDNNIPFYPLLREGRDVDVIIAIDLSADIQASTHFDRTESYIKKRGIEGWPSGAGWPNDNKSDCTEKQDNTEAARVHNKYPLGTCTVFDARSEEKVKTDEGKATVKKRHPITLAYFPFIENKSFHADFDPQETEFCSTWNFVYSSDQVDQVTELAKVNWKDNLQTIKDVLKSTWERKRRERLEEEGKR